MIDRIIDTIEKIKLTLRITIKVYKEISNYNLRKGDVVNYLVQIDVK